MAITTAASVFAVGEKEITDAATAWQASHDYIGSAREQFSIQVPATGGPFVTLDGATLTAGRTVNLIYPTDQTSGAAFDVAEALKVHYVGELTFGIVVSEAMPTGVASANQTNVSPNARTTPGIYFGNGTGPMGSPNPGGQWVFDLEVWRVLDQIRQTYTGYSSGGGIVTKRTRQSNNGGASWTAWVGW